MPSQLRGHCLDCGHDWDGLQWWIACGPVDIQEPESYRSYYCPRCFIDLCVPRRLTRSSWLRWIAENAWEMTRTPLQLGACELGVWIDSRALQVISRSPLLFQACEKVSGILAESRSSYVPVPVDVGTMTCPDCDNPMEVGCLESSLSVCPQCNSQSARSIGGLYSESLLVNYSPIKGEEVRRMILHLKALAQHREDPRFEKMLAIASRESRSALWDQELDGEMDRYES
jgi:hypothetical protein